jgi:TorA maturation chaperone TorD
MTTITIGIAMGDPGLEEAIRAAGGITELARRLGIAQPSVSNWSRVPATRVLEVEAATGVGRASLRPDLYDERDRLDEVERARGQEYALLSTLLARAPDAALLKRIARLSGDETPLGAAHAALAEAAAAATTERVEREFFDLFIGIGRGELLPYASYYLTGFLHERPLAALRGALAELGIERAAAVKEPEDHIAALCEVMSGLILGAFGSAASLARQREFFDAFMAPWALRFFRDLEGAGSARFYAAVGRVGERFLGVEQTAFAIA